MALAIAGSAPLSCDFFFGWQFLCSCRPAVFILKPRRNPGLSFSPIFGKGQNGSRACVTAFDRRCVYIMCR